ncbi:hypothetical protein M970_031510 [Encephalitozoon cuniculi EcunIII-L]|uniref:Leucine zipper domain containing protein n=1 Tax=Encephalitozoon cuniculi TaxID=6035 RepID=M1KM57_ENCCN|nr:leucine zipper domain containing protein [Encephalitozoon cuniculi]KMV66519.1 hypothetical protein M970_031510 [Encephalitozoon cuniculi EcunIII-L]
MENRKENFNYANERIQNAYAEYIYRTMHGRYPPNIHPCYFADPNLLMNKTQIHPGNYRYFSKEERQPFHQTGIYGYSPEQVDQERIKSIWKKERNRIAAKKSREKRMTRLKELEGKEHAMICEISELKEAIYDYDSILEILLRHVQGHLNRKEEMDKSFILLLDHLSRLKKPGTPRPIYLRDVGHLLSKRLSVTNEEIDRIAEAIHNSLGKLLEKD